MTSEERQSYVAGMLRRRVEAVYPSEKEVAVRLAGAERLTIYLGIDPTGAEIHLGHTIPLLLLKELFALGHDAVLLIGDFTARIGDPTGKDAARVVLTPEQIDQNMATYGEQAKKIIPETAFRIAYNSEWLGALNMEQILRLTSMVTVQQMLQRDMFQVRQKEGRPIYLNEFLYPLMQGYDSVALRTDGEIGGNDQTFNMLMGRELERELLGKDKFVITTKLLVDVATGRKMSKSEGALIAINDSAQEIRRKILAVDDGMIKTIFELCTEKNQEWISQRQAMVDAGENPKQFKEELAAELIQMYHGSEAVGQADQAIEIRQTGSLEQVLKESGLVSSLGEAKRLVGQGAVQVNGERVERWDIIIQIGDEIRVGKGKFVRVV
ncbi:MAG: tyrosine--tRNA ligase [Patescibacteria group bacterium]